MPPLKIRGGAVRKHEPFPLNQFKQPQIEAICKGIVHLKATGNLKATGTNDISGDQSSAIFAHAIGGQSFGKPLGIADVAWNGCGWSVKTVKAARPFERDHVRLISGRNNPFHSCGEDFSDPLKDVQATGQAVIEIYNARIDQAKWDHDDMRMLVLVRNMTTQEFVLFERPIAPFVVNDYTWHRNDNNNLEGHMGERHAFTWQPHGSQFTIIEPIPPGATRFRIKREPPKLLMNDVLKMIDFEPDWVEIL